MDERKSRVPIYRPEEIMKATSGVVLRSGRRKNLDGISIDSRTLQPGMIFVPVVGERHDAHTFISQSLELGASAIVGEKTRIQPEVLEKANGRWVFAVGDTTRALGDLAAFHRNRFKLPLIAITGSSGKTTTKNMTASILEISHRVHKSEGNLNNLFGLPLSLFQLTHRHNVSVVEIGMNQRGEIQRLAEIAQPDVGVITNIGPVHLQFLKTVSQVREAKAELPGVMAARGQGTLVLNADNPHSRILVERFTKLLPGRLTLFGRLAATDVQATQISPLGRDGTSFTLRLGRDQRKIQLRTPGEHNVSNAMAAAAVAWTLGASSEQVAQGLETYRPAPMRMEILDLPGGLHIVNDAYNANPDSMKAAIGTFVRLSNGGKNAVVLGDMLELGKRSASTHRSIGALIARLAGGQRGHINHLLVLGSKARLMADEALKRGMSQRRSTVCENHTDAADWLNQNMNSGDWVLLKGSRAMGLERVLERLTGKGCGLAGNNNRSLPSQNAEESA